MLSQGDPEIHSFVHEVHDVSGDQNNDTILRTGEQFLSHFSFRKPHVSQMFAWGIFLYQF